jgi:hypothetical protein
MEIKAHMDPCCTPISGCLIVVVFRVAWESLYVPVRSSVYGSPNYSRLSILFPTNDEREAMGLRSVVSNHVGSVCSPLSLEGQVNDLDCKIRMDFKMKLIGSN